MELPALRVLVLTDDLPGHFHQSRGIIKALGQNRRVDETLVPIKLRFGFARNLMRVYLNTLPARPCVACLSWFYRFEMPHLHDLDLILSAGGRTSFANAWLARALGVPNIFAGSLRKLDPGLFTRVLTLEPITGAVNNLVLPIHASPVDVIELEQEGVRLRAEKGWPQERVWLLLIGGNGAGYRYTRDDFEELARLMELLATQYAIRWLVVSSRRTGSTAEDWLRLLLKDTDVVATSWASAGDEFNLQAFLGIAERVFVTEDSMTMLTEAIYSRRPVYSLAPKHARPDERYQQTMQRFTDHGFICRYTISALFQSPATLDDTQCCPMDESPLDQLAAQLRELDL